MPLDSTRLIERIRSALRVPRYTGAWPGTLLRQSLERDPETIAMNGSDSLVTLSRTIIRKDAVYRQSDKGRSASVSGARLQQSSLRGQPEHIQKGALYLRLPCCRFAGSWGHLEGIFAGSWGQPICSMMGPPARGP